jgi:hypothetical protein
MLQNLNPFFVTASRHSLQRPARRRHEKFDVVEWEAMMTLDQHELRDGREKVPG